MPYVIVLDCLLVALLVDVPGDDDGAEIGQLQRDQTTYAGSTTGQLELET